MLGFGKLRLLSGACAGLMVWQLSGTMPQPLDEAFSAARSAVFSAVGPVVSEVAAAVLPVASASGASTTDATRDESTVVVQGRWSGCAPVPVLVNPGSLGRLPVREVKGALKHISRVSGVDFVFAGLTSEVPTLRWGSSPVRALDYGFAPVVVAFAAEGDSDVLREGWVAGAAAFPGPSGDLVSGAVVVDAGRWVELPGGPGAGVTRGSVLLHEFGHILGLGHGPDEHMMAAVLSDSSPADFTPAERAVLGSLSPSC